MPPKKVDWLKIEKGDAGIFETVRRMVQMIREGLELPMFRQMPPFTVSEMFEFAKRTIRYESDPPKIELIGRADRTISRGKGDCDDKTILLATLIKAVDPSARVRIVIGACQKNLSKEFSHVWLEWHDGEKFVTLDPTPVWAPMGWTPKSKRTQKLEI